MNQEKNSLPSRLRRRSGWRIGLMLAIAGLLWWACKEESTLYPLIRVSPSTVLETYQAEYATEAAQGRTLREIAFHHEFSGQEGESFYVVWETALGSLETEKYRITTSPEAPGYQFQYQTTFDNLQLPDRQFISFHEQSGDWKPHE